MSQTIDEKQVRHVAKLARLKLDDAQVHAMTERLAGVLDYVSKLQELDVEGVEPMAHAMDVHSVLRPDEARPGLPVEKVLASAPDAEPPFFKVPKVLGDGSSA